MAIHGKEQADEALASAEQELQEMGQAMERLEAEHAEAQEALRDRVERSLAGAQAEMESVEARLREELDAAARAAEEVRPIHDWVLQVLCSLPQLLSPLL